MKTGLQVNANILLPEACFCASWEPQKVAAGFLITHSDAASEVLRINFFFFLSFRKAVHITFSM